MIVTQGINTHTRAVQCVYNDNWVLEALRGNCAYCNHWDDALHPQGAVCESCLKEALDRLTPPRPVRARQQVIEDPTEEEAKVMLDLFADIATIKAKLDHVRRFKAEAGLNLL